MNNWDTVLSSLTPKERRALLSLALTSEGLDLSDFLPTEQRKMLLSLTCRVTSDSNLVMLASAYHRGTLQVRWSSSISGCWASQLFSWGTCHMGAHHPTSIIKETPLSIAWLSRAVLGAASTSVFDLPPR